ncbi:MAG: hypothetical protein B7Y39_08615 [Bdellovibrio sp. 28-41-41]|nr:MAG: hypothetical protein B7Y39_08615 [Bdellovibrio sp. 28-41-41]
MKILKISSLILVYFFAKAALAHGEDKPGPNGGFVRMPGAFHTEVVPVGQNSLKIYLLDIEWKNPSVIGSSVSVTYKGSRTTKKECSIESNYYICEFPKSINLRKKGELLVDAQRENQKGNIVSYELPLKLQVIDDGHGGHH